MMKKKNLIGLGFLLAISLLWTACSPQSATTENAPTVDANVIYTQAAQTVEAGLAMTQAAMPPTATATEAIPTATMDPAIVEGMTATAAAVLPGSEVAATATLQPGAPTATLAPTATAVVLLPTATKAAGVQPQTTSADKCEWVSNSPADGASIPAEADFDTVIRVKNTGTTTWNSEYVLRYYAGDRMDAPYDFYVQGTVAPNQTYDFIFPMEAPDSTGKKEVIFVVQNAERSTMCVINIPLNITD